LGSTDGRYVIVVCDEKAVMIINLSESKCVSILEHDYISNVLLYNEGRNLWIGTWEKTYIYDFYELVGRDVRGRGRFV